MELGPDLKSIKFEDLSDEGLARCLDDALETGDVILMTSVMKEATDRLGDDFSFEGSNTDGQGS